jgi:hypothetical protein
MGYVLSFLGLGMAALQTNMADNAMRDHGGAAHVDALASLRSTVRGRLVAPSLDTSCTDHTANNSTMQSTHSLKGTWFQSLNLKRDILVSKFALANAACTATPRGERFGEHAVRQRHGAGHRGGRGVAHRRARGKGWRTRCALVRLVTWTILAVIYCVLIIQPTRVVTPRGVPDW